MFIISDVQFSKLHLNLQSITQVEIVLACVALHNFLRKECRSDEFPIEEESASSSSSPIVEEELEELVSQTQEQQREEANAWRLNIANYMWRERY
ncbi:hypothetical protein Dsin_021910 [Dipteronia sinensis]|uniref:DDE Tnp4 domain-containing protein n=1 Tax=Dipteronia sinensis TaxID=43782 RepID=A0AAE0A0J3_9ROSI|nr:hypothetical protein Dsin_021910 [Dipteronia sinensis]